MSEVQTSQFTGWAIVELFGHQQAAGYVTTEQYGQACLFRIDTPELPAREITTNRPGYVNDEWMPAGTKVQRPSEPGRSKLVGPGAVYAINPCTEELVREHLERSRSLPLIVLERPKEAAPALAGPELGDGPEEQEDIDD